MESRILVVIAIVVLSLAALASTGHSGAEAVVITKVDDGKEITVPEGSIFEVRLEQSSGTGYSWEIVDPDQTHLQVLEATDTALSHLPKVGGPLRKTWQIKAVKAGQTELRILLYRPWEGIEKAAEKFQVKIRIE